MSDLSMVCECGNVDAWTRGILTSAYLPPQRCSSVCFLTFAFCSVFCACACRTTSSTYTQKHWLLLCVHAAELACVDLGCCSCSHPPRSVANEKEFSCEMNNANSAIKD